jgi:putative membrane protein
MKKYLDVSLMMIPSLLVSCARESGFGPQGPGGWGNMMHYGTGYGGMFMWIIILIVIGVLVYFFVQSQNKKGQTPAQNESHLDILKRRYAKGEIEKEEYEKMKKDLEG